MYFIEYKKFLSLAGHAMYFSHVIKNAKRYKKILKDTKNYKKIQKDVIPSVESEEELRGGSGGGFGPDGLQLLPDSVVEVEGVQVVEVLALPS